MNYQLIIITHESAENLIIRRKYLYTSTSSCGYWSRGPEVLPRPGVSLTPQGAPLPLLPRGSYVVLGVFITCVQRMMMMSQMKASKVGD